MPVKTKKHDGPKSTDGGAPSTSGSNTGTAKAPTLQELESTAWEKNGNAALRTAVATTATVPTAAAADHPPTKDKKTKSLKQPKSLKRRSFDYLLTALVKDDNNSNDDKHPAKGGDSAPRPSRRSSMSSAPVASSSTPAPSAGRKKSNKHSSQQSINSTRQQSNSTRLQMDRENAEWVESGSAKMKGNSNNPKAAQNSRRQTSSRDNIDIDIDANNNMAMAQQHPPPQRPRRVPSRPSSPSNATLDGSLRLDDLELSSSHNSRQNSSSNFSINHHNHSQTSQKHHSHFNNTNTNSSSNTSSSNNSIGSFNRAYNKPIPIPPSRQNNLHRRRSYVDGAAYNSNSYLDTQLSPTATQGHHDPVSYHQNQHRNVQPNTSSSSSQPHSYHQDPLNRRRSDGYTPRDIPPPFGRNDDGYNPKLVMSPRTVHTTAHTGAVHADDYISQSYREGSSGTSSRGVHNFPFYSPQVTKPKAKSFHVNSSNNASKNHMHPHQGEGTAPKKREPRRRSPHPVRGFVDSSEKQQHQHSSLTKKSSQESQSGNSNTRHHSNGNIAASPTTPRGTNEPEGLSSPPSDGLQQGGGSSSDGDDDASVATIHTTSDASIEQDTIDVQEVQTADQLRGLIEMMQAEFEKLRRAKMNAEMKAQTLETDLVSSQEERDAEFVKLSEEKEHWKRLAQNEKVRYESIQGKVGTLEKEMDQMKNEWSRAFKGKHNAEERCDVLENENRHLKQLLKKNRHQQQPLVIPKSGSIGSPTERYHTPPSSPTPPFDDGSDVAAFSNVSSSSHQYPQYPQSVHSRRQHPNMGRHLPQEPMSWHAGKQKKIVRKMPLIAPPLGNTFSRTDAGSGNINNTGHQHAASRSKQPRRASLRRKSSHNSASTDSTLRSSLTNTLRDSALTCSMNEDDPDFTVAAAASSPSSRSLDGMVVLMEDEDKGPDIHGC